MAAGSFISSSETPPAAGSSGVGGHGETGRFRRLWSLAPVLSWTVLFLFLAEVLVAVVAPALLSDRLYLRAYLGRDARENTTQIAGDLGSYLTWNPVTGWRNRPNSSRKKWQVDEHGARATHAFGQHKEGRRRILFLGDSMTNGGTAVTRDETISAYVEDADTEALNFGTMLFGLDQMLLDYENRLGAFEADVVVVGLSENAMAGLANRYVPFRRRSETNMPYFKPRFAIESGRLRLIPVPPRDAYERLLTRADLLPELRETDDFYGEFAAFKRCGWLPLSGAAWKIYHATRSLQTSFRSGSPSPLLAAVMRETVRAADKRGATVVFMLLPDVAATEPGRVRRLFPDRYARLVFGMRAQGFTILDAREAIRRSGRPMAELFEPDGTHYTALGNRVIAEALRPFITTARATAKLAPAPEAASE